MLLCCCSITNSDCVTRSDLSGIRGSKLLCLPLEVGDMTDRVVTNVDFDPEGIRRITVSPDPRTNGGTHLGEVVTDGSSNDNSRR